MSAAWIRKLCESDSRLTKEEVLRQALALAVLGGQEAQVFLGLVKATYDPMVTWGIKQVQDTIGITSAENPWSEFNDLLISLYRRKLTGNAARDAVADMAMRFTSDEWNTFCVAVLRKDLRAGISDKTVNKVCKGTQWEIPVFSCQLATSCEDRPEMKGIKRLEPKLDGVRVLMVCNIDESSKAVSVVAYSRNGKVFDNFGHIESQIADVMDRLSGRTGYNSFVLDGEIIGTSFQALMRQARRKENIEASDSTFHIFDFIPLADFTRGFWEVPLKQRLTELIKIRSDMEKMTSVALLPHIEVNLDTALGREQFDRYAKDSVTQGFEGIMIKSLDSPYQCKRNTFWLKWKPTVSVDLEVIDVEEGTGRNVGRLGALVCSGVDGGKTITVNCGSGFSDSDRDSLWADRDLVIGRTVEILCDVITRNMDGTYSLRFPRFLRFRDDKQQG